MKKKKISDHEAELKKNPVNQYRCCETWFNHNEFIQHLTDTHKLSKEQCKGSRSLITHIDYDYYYSSQYKCELESGLIFTQYIEQARADDDMMRMP